MSNVSTWSATASSNNSAPPNGFPEGMAPSAVNDAAREVMAAVARWHQDTKGALSSSGSGSAYVITSASPHTTHAAVGAIAFRAHTTSTGAATLAVDGLAPKPLRIAGVAVEAGNIVADSIIVAIYNPLIDCFDVLGGVQASGVGGPVTLTKSTTNTSSSESHAHALDSSIWDTATRSTSTTLAAGQVHAVSAGVTIPSLAAGKWTAVYNSSSGAITLTQGGGQTLRLAGTATSGNRTLAARGLAVIWFNSSTEAICSGSGVS
jgi:hypothetical protein